MDSRAVCIASPSLALTKYWGKLRGATNLPATGSVAVTLGGLDSRTDVHAERLRNVEDRVYLDGVHQPAERYRAFFSAFRSLIASTQESKSAHASAAPSGKPIRAALSHGSPYASELPQLSLIAVSRNNFPTAAGVASSSSGFAALAGACLALFGYAPATSDSHAASQLARVGSGSAARSVFGGFSYWPAGAERAEQLFPEAHWPELRIVIAIVSGDQKATSSRDAMNATRDTSPFYDAWTESTARDVDAARDALTARRLDLLGPVIRRSYLRMFATMYAAEPPILYWAPKSVAVQTACEDLRRAGIPAWETMDAGPQVKVVTLAEHVESVRNAITDAVPGTQCLVAAPGQGLRVEAPRSDTHRSSTESAHESETNPEPRTR